MQGNLRGACREAWFSGRCFVLFAIALMLLISISIARQQSSYVLHCVKVDELLPELQKDLNVRAGRAEICGSVLRGCHRSLEALPVRRAYLCDCVLGYAQHPLPLLMPVLAPPR